VLGIVINRVGAEGSGGYYGYASGYGFGYRYDTGYARDEDDEDRAEFATAEAPGSASDASDQASLREARLRSGIVPRRVA
jgi:hypothetical protein